MLEEEESGLRHHERDPDQSCCCRTVVTISEPVYAVCRATCALPSSRLLSAASFRMLIWMPGFIRDPFFPIPSLTVFAASCSLPSHSAA